MRILLVGSPKTIVGFDRVTKLPNLGLNSIAANILSNTIDVKILDLVLVNHRPDQFFLGYLRFYRPDVVGFSCMTFQFNETIKLARIVRQFDGKIKIVLGGYHPTVEFTNILESEDGRVVDFIVRNEGEIAFNLLAAQIQGEGNFHGIPFLSYMEKEKAIHNPRGNTLELDRLKIPDRRNRVIQKGFHVLGSPADAVETSRGCVNHCKFCCIRQMYGTQFRTYKIERVLEDILDARNQGARAILIVDDNITVDANRFENLCEEMIHRRLNDVKYAVQASIPGLKRNPRLPKLMSKAGVDICFLGIENNFAGNIDFLDTKQILNSETRELVSELQGYGITVIGSFIIGNPGDTREIIYDNFHYANEVNIDIPLFLILTPLPKTEIREELLKKKLITNPDDYSKYDLFHANVKTHYLTSRDLEKIRDEIAFKILRKSSRFWRLAKKYPKFSTRLLFDQLINQPREVFGYVQGIFR
jgi:anaerobic magnesium-protoporphyrin IX monomethyl ester cyclase